MFNLLSILFNLIVFFSINCHGLMVFLIAVLCYKRKENKFILFYYYSYYSYKIIFLCMPYLLYIV